MYPGIKHCNECPLECDTYMFQPTKEQLQTFEDKFDLIVVLEASNRIIRIKFSVKLSILEFIIYIASCFGLWFGLSVFQSLNDIQCLLDLVNVRKSWFWLTKSSNWVYRVRHFNMGSIGVIILILTIVNNDARRTQLSNCWWLKSMIRQLIQWTQQFLRVVYPKSSHFKPSWVNWVH